MERTDVVPEGDVTSGIIQQMDVNLANKIAAGEVVQRPASAAKELIENAIDAGATTIQVFLKSSGKELIQVVDDGCGMGQTDALLCFERHATSKIRVIEDLEHIHTLGFRGEALASIAAVAQVELRTKRIPDTSGFKVEIHGGEVIDTAPCATENGTSISIKNLFYNVPARRNFLKTPATEFKHLVETFQFLALSNPDLSFLMYHDGNEVYRLMAQDGIAYDEQLRSRVVQVFGDAYADRLLPVNEATSYLSVRGFIGTPTYYKKGRGEQFLFVNGRYVKNRYLEHAIISAYEQLLPKGSYPLFTLFLGIDPRHVDVNVHPTKAEVKFDDERGVYGFLRAVIKKALGEQLLSPQMSQLTTTTEVPTTAPGIPRLPAQATPARSTTFTEKAPIRRSPESHRTVEAPGVLSKRLYQTPQFAPDSFSLASQATPPPTEEPGSPFKENLLWQLHDQFILTQIHSGLVIIDQQAAHQRVLYEQALQCLKDGFGLSQQLLFPQTLSFSPADFALIKELQPDLTALGFDVDFLSGRSVIVRGVPADLRAGHEQNILEDLLAQYTQQTATLQELKREQLAKSLALRMGIKTGSTLSIKEMRTLIDKLFLCEMPYACPNGKPTIVKISMEELEKRFGR